METDSVTLYQPTLDDHTRLRPRPLLCSLAAFGMSAIYRLQGVPGAGGTLLATSVVLAYAPLLLALIAVWPAVYVQHRQPIVMAMKIWAAFVATLLPQQHGASLGAAPEGARPPTETLLHAGAGIVMQLALHALGEPQGRLLLTYKACRLTAFAHAAAAAR